MIPQSTLLELILLLLKLNSDLNISDFEKKKQPLNTINMLNEKKIKSEKNN